METKRIPPRRNRTGRRQARNSRTPDHVREQRGRTSVKRSEGTPNKSLFIALSVHEENQKAKICIGEDENSKSTV